MIRVALAGALVVLLLLSLATGPAPLSALQSLKALFGDEGVATTIVRDVRLPRALLALAIGAALGLAGATLQGLLRNPLAEPAVFGAPQAAALGAVLALHFGGASAIGLLMPAAAVLGALISVGLVLMLAARDDGLAGFVLAGLALAGFAGALTALAISLAPNPFAVTEMVFWLMGSLEDRGFHHLLMFLPFGLIGAALLLSAAGPLRALTLGPEAAASLGVDVDRTRAVIAVGAALIVGGAAAVAGAIGFIGLIAPHVARLLGGADPKRLLVTSALAGGALLLAADLTARLAPGGVDLKLGVLTALIGAPVFLMLVLRRRSLGVLG
jgi:iron complex transport system permease protein